MFRGHEMPPYGFLDPGGAIFLFSFYVFGRLPVIFS